MESPLEDDGISRVDMMILRWYNTKKYFSNHIQDYLNKDRDKLSEGRQYNFYLLPQSHSLESHNLWFYRFPIMNPGG